jgi:hypothetical protein
MQLQMSLQEGGRRRFDIEEDRVTAEARCCPADRMERVAPWPGMQLWKLEKAGK